MMVFLYCCKNGTENHNLWQRCRCILNDKAMILANACRDFRFGTNFSIQTCNYGKSYTSMGSKLPHIWHSFYDLHTDSNHMSYCCLELMIFKDQTVCQGWGLPVSGTGLPKVSPQEDFLFKRISNILELKVYSIKHLPSIALPPPPLYYGTFLLLQIDSSSSF